MDETPHAGHTPKAPVHYYGDIVRAVFLAAAVVMLIAGFTTTLPLSTTLIIVWIVVLVLIAGLTNPVQRGVQWANVVISVVGVLVFGGDALNRHHSFSAAFTSGILTVILALLFVISLYFATRTLRAQILLKHF